MQITIEAREVYGKTLFYPVCKQAKAFAYLCNAKTLTPENLRTVRDDLGVEIKFWQKDPAI